MATPDPTKGGGPGSNPTTRGLITDYEFYDDFLTAGYAADLALANESNPAAKFSEVADAGDWLVTRDVAPTIVVADSEPGGVLLVTTGGSAGDFASCQLNGTSFAVNADKDIVFEARVKFDDGNDTQWFIGLASADVTGTTLGPILDGTNDSIGFRQPGATDVDIDYVVEDDTTETTADTGVDIVDDTFLVLTFIVTSTTNVRFLIDGNFIADVTTNLPDAGAALTPTFEVSGPTANSTIEIDYIYCSQVR